MNRICLLDPGIENREEDKSSNLGDLIIQESIEREIFKIFSNIKIFRLSTQSRLTKKELKEVSNCSLILVGGTNLLSSKMNEYRQWKIFLADAFKLRNAILFGVGWWQYQTGVNLYTKMLLNFALSRNYYHSVRDHYTSKKLVLSGISNVINTGCPTMWPLMELNQNEIPQQKADHALLMLTDYNKSPNLDRKLVQLLLEKYEKVYFWPQGRFDLQYAKDLNLPLDFLEHSFEALQAFLKSDIDFDYVGTRLHGGIYCLRSGRRALIIEIDNRAREIGKETGLPTVERDNFAYIEKWIEDSQKNNIYLDTNAIERWRGQFSNLTQYLATNKVTLCGNLLEKK